MAANLENKNDVEAFLAREDREEALYELSRPQLLLIAEYYGMETPVGVKKGALLRDIVRMMSDGVSGVSVSPSMSDQLQVLMQQTRMKELDMEEKKMDLAIEKFKVEERMRQREFELVKMEKEREQKEIELAKLKEEERRSEKVREELRLEHVRQQQFELAKMREENERERMESERQAEREREQRAHELEIARIQHSSRERDDFNINAALKLVPIFRETEVAEFFIAFEKLAHRLSWPKENWSTLVQCRLVGRAQKVYVTLSEETSGDYDQVKTLILKAYELIPEAYRQKFRELRKFHQQTYVEFAALKSQNFDDWCRAKEVDDFNKLRELVLIEEFKNCVPREIKVYIEENHADTLEDAAKKADEYSLSHKSYFRPKYSGFYNKPREAFEKGKFNRSLPVKGSKSPQRSGGLRSPQRGGRSRTPPKGGIQDVTCYFCNKKGHYRSDCPALKRGRPVSLVGTLGEPEEKLLKGYGKYLHKGKVGSGSQNELTKDVVMLRDTGALQSLILRQSLPLDFKETKSEYVLLGGFPNTLTSCPVENVTIDSDLVTGQVRMAVVDELPVRGVDVIIANDVMNDEKCEGVNPIIVVEPRETDTDHMVTVLPLTRSQKKSEIEESMNLKALFEDNSMTRKTKGSKETQGKSMVKGSDEVWNVAELIGEQKKDQTLSKLKGKIVDVVRESEDLTRPYFKLRDGVLIRVRRPIYDSSDNCNVLTQIVIPVPFRNKIMKIAHEHVLSGHFGVSKTHKRVLQHFYWPKMRRDIKNFVRTCHQCQVVGSPNIKITKAPLRPIPVVKEPFHEVLIDIVGPLPKTKSGNTCILTILDRTTRYPEAIPLRTFKAEKVVKVLIEYFARFGLPEVIQSDCGTNFTSKYFSDKMKELQIRHVTSSPYHPESQGSIERFHQTLKTLLKKYSGEESENWDQELPYLLFAVRSIPNDSLGMSPFELVFGHNVRGPLDVVREHWEGETPDVNLLEFVSESREKLVKRWEFANRYLKGKQQEMKRKYDCGTRERVFEVGDLVLALLPTPGSPFKAAFTGPLRVSRKVSDVNYLVETPCRRKKYQLCHVNMLKRYYNRDEAKPLACVNRVGESKSEMEWDGSWPETNEAAYERLDEMLAHLADDKKGELKDLLGNFKELFRNTPGRTHLLKHDVDVGNATPVKQHPYRMNPGKSALVEKEVQYMLDNKLVKPSKSPWSSPVVLVKKDHDQYRLCFDYRKLNSVSKADNYPIPRIDDCIDAVAKAKYITKIDMLKGYWQVGMTARAQEYSAFITPKGLYECLVMPFGMRNSASTFQRLMNEVTRDVSNCVVYIDDVVIYNDDWSGHMDCLRDFFLAVRHAGLVVNLAKCEFARARVKYLGHEVGFGQVVPKASNIQAITNLKVPVCKKDVRRFLGAAGYFRKFVKNFAEVSCPLTDLLQKSSKFKWDEACQTAFNHIKAILTSYPLLKSPDFQRPFILRTDASDKGVGAVLEQADQNGVRHPVSYFSKKLNSAQQNYSTVEKETLSLILAIEHYGVYLSGSKSVEVWTDHNPLTFLQKFKYKNQRLTRWSLFLQEWNLDIHHIKGKENLIPDLLSRDQ